MFSGFSPPLFQNHGLNNFKYKRQWTSNNTNITPQALWNLSTFDLTELISNIIVRTWTEDAFSVLVSRDSVVSLKNIDIKIQRSLPYGQCYTLQLHNILKTFRIRQVKIKWLECKNVSYVIVLHLNFSPTGFSLALLLSTLQTYF